jgi:hypothetical protein
MNDFSGYGEIKLCDKTLPFKFGTNAYKLLSKERNLEFYETFQAIKNPFVLIELAYFAHVTANRIAGKVTEISIDEFTDMVGETKGAMVEFGKLIEESKMWGMTFDELVESGKKKI